MTKEQMLERLQKQILEEIDAAGFLYALSRQYGNDEEGRRHSKEDMQNADKHEEQAIYLAVLFADDIVERQLIQSGIMMAICLISHKKYTDEWFALW